MPPPDLSRVSDAALRAEWARRNASKRITKSGGRNGGRPPVLRTCAKCGHVAGTAAMRAHRCA